MQKKKIDPGEVKIFGGRPVPIPANQNLIFASFVLVLLAGGFFAGMWYAGKGKQPESRLALLAASEQLEHAKCLGANLTLRQQLATQDEELNNRENTTLRRLKASDIAP